MANGRSSRGPISTHFKPLLTSLLHYTQVKTNHIAKSEIQEQEDILFLWREKGKSYDKGHGCVILTGMFEELETNESVFYNLFSNSWPCS